MSEFFFQQPFPHGADATEYVHLTKEGVSVRDFGGRTFLVVEPSALTALAEKALFEVSYFLRPAHQEKVSRILKDPEASLNDRFVAVTMLRNAVVSAEGVLPFCQDTGTATVVAKKGQLVFTGGGDEEALARGIFNAYQKYDLRYSQVAPLSMYEERNTCTNLPAQIDIYAVDGATYEFLFVAKGGGSANKTQLYQMTKALLNPESLVSFLVEKMRSLGTAACPPYHIAFVVGGTSAEANLKAVKLASAGALDDLPTTGNEHGRAFRDPELEARLLQAAHELGIGAQFGGKYFAHDVRIVRLPRHGASCPVGMGVSCSADRNLKARIDADGIWIEKLDHAPGRLLGDLALGGGAHAGGVRVDLNRPMKEILADLSKYAVKTLVLLNGTLVVARDMAHARLKERLDRGEGLPDYIKDHPVYYAGPAKKPEGYASGSFGPTTAGRMDAYVDLFQSHGGSMIMLAKGNRSREVTEACQRHGGFYLGSIGGPAAILAKDHIRSVEVLDYPELGMEAVWKIEVVDFPAVIVVDDKGNDMYAPR